MIDQPRQLGGGRRAIGDVAPKLAALTDDVLFEDVWNRPELSARDRSLITVAALITGGNADQLPHHLTRALENGLTDTELLEAITHLAFYAGWPKAMTAVTTARQVFGHYQTRGELSIGHGLRNRLVEPEDTRPLLARASWTAAEPQRREHRVSHLHHRLRPGPR